MKHEYYIKNYSSKFIEIKGTDALEFLQGLITNDINKCQKENIIYSCMLSPQGKFLADFFVTIYKENYLIEIDDVYFDSFLKKLNLYKLRSDVEFNEKKNLISLILYTDNKSKFENINLYKDPRNLNLGYKIYLDNKNSILKETSEYNFNLYRKNLIKNLIPFAPKDLTENKSLLLENNFQNINAIDWNKGCYVGQEITARMKYRSLLKKQIYVLEIISGQLKEGEEIIENDIKLGDVISIVDKYTLCMLKINLIGDKPLNKSEIHISNKTILKFL